MVLQNSLTAGRNRTEGKKKESPRTLYCCIQKQRYGVCYISNSGRVETTVCGRLWPMLYTAKSSAGHRLLILAAGQLLRHRDHLTFAITQIRSKTVIHRFVFRTTVFSFSKKVAFENHLLNQLHFTLPAPPPFLQSGGRLHFIINIQTQKDSTTMFMVIIWACNQMVGITSNRV